jgi:hypothetical protein
MPQRHPRCPKCQGQLYREPADETRFALPPELACWQCGWRQAYSPRQFERRLALRSETDDDRYASDGTVAPAD